MHIGVGRATLYRWFAERKLDPEQIVPMKERSKHGRG